MSDVVDARRLRSEKIVYGYIGTRIFTRSEIPADIRNLCHKYYHIVDVFDIHKVHEDVKISGDGLTATKTNICAYHRLVYGTIGIDSKTGLKYQWKLTVTKYHGIIGISDNPNIKGSYPSIHYGF